MTPGMGAPRAFLTASELVSRSPGTRDWRQASLPAPFQAFMARWRDHVLPDSRARGGVMSAYSGPSAEPCAFAAAPSEGRALGPCRRAVTVIAAVDAMHR